MERRTSLDVLKGVAIVLVVFNHALLWPMRAGDRTSAFAYGIAFGTVAAFSAVAGYVQGFHPPREERAVLRKRAGQLLVPWAIWMPIYAVAPLVWQSIGGGELPVMLNPGPWAREILLGGGPLWFLPVLFAATAVCAFLDMRTRSWWPAWAALGAYVALAAASFVSNTSPLDLGNGTFWAVAPLYVAAFWFGLRVSRDGLPSTSGGALIALILCSMLTGGVVTLVRAANPGLRWLMWLPYAIGVVGGCAALVLAARDAAAEDAFGNPTGVARAFAVTAPDGRQTVLRGALLARPLHTASGDGRPGGARRARLGRSLAVCGPRPGGRRTRHAGRGVSAGGSGIPPGGVSGCGVALRPLTRGRGGGSDCL